MCIVFLHYWLVGICFSISLERGYACGRPWSRDRTRRDLLASVLKALLFPWCTAWRARLARQVGAEIGCRRCEDAVGR